MTYIKGKLFDDKVVLLSKKTVDVSGSWIGLNKSFNAEAYDSNTLKFFFERLSNKSDAIFFDIGANTGSFCLLSKFTNSKCYAFEPQRNVYRLLKLNIIANDLAKRVFPLRLALGAERGKMLELKVPEKNEGLASFGQMDAKGVVKKEQNRLETLDGFVGSKKLKKIDMIKIDVEGFEQFVLEGAKEVLQKFKPELLVEYPKTYQCGYSPTKIIRSMNELGYSCFVLSEEDLYFYHKKRSNLKLGSKKILLNFFKVSAMLLKHSQVMNYFRNFYK